MNSRHRSELGVPQILDGGVVHLKSVLLCLAALGVAGTVVAQPAADAPADAAGAVPELTVSAAADCLEPLADPAVPPPKVVSTYPANGATVRPGILVVRVTFDQPMSCHGFFAGSDRLPSPCPPGQQAWVQSYDRKTIRTVCHAEANVHYGVFMSDRRSKLFVSLAGKPLPAYAFTFSTSLERAFLTVGDSLEDDAEMQPKPQDVPIKVQELHIKH